MKHNINLSNNTMILNNNVVNTLPGEYIVTEKPYQIIATHKDYKESDMLYSNRIIKTYSNNPYTGIIDADYYKDLCDVKGEFTYKPNTKIAKTMPATTDEISAADEIAGWYEKAWFGDMTNKQSEDAKKRVYELIQEYDIPDWLSITQTGIRKLITNKADTLKNNGIILDMETESYLIELAFNKNNQVISIKITAENRAYEIYKIQWMIDHNYFLSDLIRELDYYSDYYKNTNMSIKEIFTEWENESGFTDGMYVCEDEFMDNENRA